MDERLRRPSSDSQANEQAVAISGSSLGHDVHTRRRPSLMLKMLMMSQAFAVFTFTLGVVVLVGYVLRQRSIVELSPHLPPMYPVTALAFVAGGFAAWTIRRPQGGLRAVALLLSSLVLGAGVAVLVLHAVGAGPTWFDLWPTPQIVAPTTPIPGRPVVETGLALSLVGAAIVLSLLRRVPKVAQGLAISALTIGVAAVLGYLVGVDRRAYGGSLVAVGMALHTAVGIVALGFAALLSQPGVGILRAVTAAGTYGALGRRLVFASLVMPLTLAALGVIALKTFTDRDLTLSMLATVQVAALSLLVLIPIAALEKQQAAIDDMREFRERDAEAAGSATDMERALAAEMTAQPLSPAGWEVSAYLEPAHGHLAGDSFQVLHRDDGRTLFAVIDVVGHGAIAGILAMRLRVQIETLWSRGAGIESVAGVLNDTVLFERSFATALLVDFTAASGSAEYVNAGHCPGVHVRRDRVEFLPATGPAFGVRNRDRGVATIELDPSDLLVIYTDGLTEAMNLQRDLLGEDHALALITAFAPDGPDATARACVDAAREHSQGRLRDDVLVLGARRL